MSGFKKVLIADDHTIFREGLKVILAAIDRTTMIDEAGNTQEVCKKIKISDYDLVILDITMPGRSGLDCLVEIKKTRPNLPVIIMSSHLEEQLALRAYKSGASAYLNKGGPTEELLEALRKISTGHKYVTPAIADILITELAAPRPDEVLSRLSNREYEVLCMIASGKPVGKIASELSLSVKTISAYRSHILQKLNMKSNAEITRFAIDNGML